MHNNVPDWHGNYNAGLLLTDDLAIANKWIELYEKGVGDFYEQKLLEKLDDLYVVDLFPSDWNWGAWRNQEDIKHSRRVPTFLHTHVVGPHTQDTPLHEVAVNRNFVMRASYGTYPKYAFYHNAKAAGSEFMKILRQQVEPKLQYQILNSYEVRSTDWTELELRDIAVERFKFQHGNRFIVHNHAFAWSEDSISLFKQFGWKFIALYRPIRERMASFYYWNLDCINTKGKSFMRGSIPTARGINDFFEAMLTSAHLGEWVLPNDAQRMTWYSADEAGIKACIMKHFNLSISQVGHANQSNNLGWAHVEQLLDTNLLARLEVEFAKWDNFEQQGLINYGTR
jgi:hypothetical protein